MSFRPCATKGCKYTAYGGRNLCDKCRKEDDENVSSVFDGIDIGSTYDASDFSCDTSSDSCDSGFDGGGGDCGGGGASGDW